MSRRVSLPGADELFRTTGGRGLQPSTPRQHANGETPGDSADRPLRPVPAPAGPSAAEEPEGAEEAPVQESAAPAEEAEHTGRDSGTAPAARPVPEQASPAGQPGRRTLQPPAGSPGAAASSAAVPAVPQPVQPAQQQPRRKSGRAPRRPSGRERHDEKITVYVSAEELMDLEHARLVLRGEHGLAVDRGRIVREAVAVVLADLESRGDASILVRRLRGR
ncbi:hypothetical protein ACIP98_18275 [Streptomyces sp. NPDC088354]|uniref:hypothetical protein n=1 Tax=unclassified Streptomyces TaxID=2593676 RepID=UPI0029A421C2|nr:hypothetical protein [Streptomyces sp. MI02-7b]MDX3074986.1 hypothetical protein [Streptomyces sp. MI02-7b]